MFQRCARKYLEGHKVWQTTHSLQRRLTNRCSQGVLPLLGQSRLIYKGKKKTETNRPCFICGGSKSLEDFGQLIEIRVSSKEWYLQRGRQSFNRSAQWMDIYVKFMYPKKQLCQDASHRPHVNANPIHPGTKQELRGAVPPKEAVGENGANSHVKRNKTLRCFLPLEPSLTEQHSFMASFH